MIKWGKTAVGKWFIWEQNNEMGHNRGPNGQSATRQKNLEGGEGRSQSLAERKSGLRGAFGFTKSMRQGAGTEKKGEKKQKMGKDRESRKRKKRSGVGRSALSSQTFPRKNTLNERRGSRGSVRNGAEVNHFEYSDE